MFKSILLSLLIIPLLFIISSCDNCNLTDCDENNRKGLLSLVSANTDQDLVFGPGKVYSIEQLEFYSIINGDTVFHQVQHYLNPALVNDSLLLVDLSELPETVFLRLQNTDVDTLQLTYNASESKCCGSYTRIETLGFNSDTQSSGANGVFVMNK